MIVALHGFLGLPADWRSALAGREDIHTVDLWAYARAIRAEGNAVVDMEFDAFAAWTNLFIREIEALIQRTGTKPVLLGYSMGGRLALHALVAKPELFESAVIVSANPGLVRADEKAARLSNDKVWAERFRSEAWGDVLRKWNAQGVLAPPPSVAPHERIELARDEKDFDRESLAQAMEAWSLGHQRNLRSEIQTLRMPILFVSGKHDTKFTQLLQSLELNQEQARIVIENAGHRVPWDDPKGFARVVERFTLEGSSKFANS